VGAIQFAAFRWLFGLYLLVHFAHMLPWSAELFSAEGIFRDPSALPLHGLFPNVLAIWDSPAALRLFVGALCAAAVSFACGVLRPLSAVLIWYGATCLFNRNPLIANPALPYVGLTLLFCALVPTGEGLAVGRRLPRDDWVMPPWIPHTAFLLLMAGYTYSGLVKLQSPSWVHGDAVRLLLDNPLARPWALRSTLHALPPIVLGLLGWSSLAVEILALPLALWRPTRLVAWGASLAMQVGILFVIDFADLTLGMVMAHLFVFDPHWLPRQSDGLRRSAQN